MIKSRCEYDLQVEKDSVITKGKKYWSPVGYDSSTIEDARSWLKSDFKIWKEQPNIKYRIIETIYWEPTINIVEESNRKV